MPPTQQTYRPELTNAGLAPTHPVRVVDECNRSRDAEIPGESPLILYVDGREIVTLMTLGNYPELLILGWLHNQRIITDITQLKSLQVDWETESVAITTHRAVEDLDRKLQHKTVTTGCGQRPDWSTASMALIAAFSCSGV